MHSAFQSTRKLFTEEVNTTCYILNDRDLVKLNVSQMKVLGLPSSKSLSKWVKMQIHHAHLDLVNQNLWGKGLGICILNTPTFDSGVH